MDSKKFVFETSVVTFFYDSDPYGIRGKISSFVNTNFHVIREDATTVVQLLSENVDDWKSYQFFDEGHDKELFGEYYTQLIDWCKFRLNLWFSCFEEINKKYFPRKNYSKHLVLDNSNRVLASYYISDSHLNEQEILPEVILIRYIG